MVNKISKFFTCMLACVLVFVGKIAAKTWYVDPLGNDVPTAGSQASPWKSLSYACTKVLTSGDIIHLNAGTFTETSESNLKQGISIEGDGIDKSKLISALPTGLIKVQSPSFVNGTMSLVKGNKRDSSKSVYVHGNRVICDKGNENWGIEDVNVSKRDGLLGWQCK